MSPEPSGCPAELDLTAFWQVTYGLYLCTTRSGDKKGGCVVNTFAQIAEQPCVVTVSLSKKNLTHDLVAKSRVFSVQVLEKETPVRFVGHWGFHSGRDTDKFEGVKHRDGAAGCPVVLEHTIASFEVKVTDTIDSGTHTLFIGNTVNAERLMPGEPLTYAYYQKVKGGKTGRNAPGYGASIAKPKTSE